MNIFNYAFKTNALVVALMLSSCANFGEPAVELGMTESTVLSRLGQPTHRYSDQDGWILEYARGFGGQQTYMARIDSANRLVSFEQVLTFSKFATLKAGIANKNDVLKTIGSPSETSFLSLREMEVWSYAYKENGVWDSMMHVHFDKQGIVREMMNGPDLSRDPDMYFPFRSPRKR